MADRKISELTALTTPASGDYLPIVDISEAAAADKNKRITMTELLRGGPDGTAEAPAFAFVSDSDTGVFRSGTNALGFTTGGSQRLTIDSSGRLLVGTTSRLLDNTNDLVQVLADSGGGIVLGLNDPSVFAGNNLGKISFAGRDATGGTYASFAEITAQADGTHDPGTNPTRLTFSTTPASSASPVERLRIYNNGDITLFNCTKLYPATDNATSLGLSGNRFSVVYAATGTINTSDANQKQDIEDLDAAELSVATAIKGLIKKFRFIDAVADKGDDARIHVGVIAQEVEEAFVDAGLDPRRYGMFCEDVLEDGTKRLGIRYNELLAFVIAAL